MGQEVSQLRCTGIASLLVFVIFFFKQQQFISHSCEGWEARDQGISVVTPR